MGDMRDLPSLVSAAKGITGIVHLAALKVDEKDSVAVNIRGAENLIQAARENKVRYLINISSSATKLPKKGLYAETKIAADRVIEGSGIPYTTLKPSIVYGDTTSGVFGSLAKFAKLPIVPVVGNGACIFWPIHVDDLAEIIVRTLSRTHMRGHAYDVGGPQALSINDMLRKISRELWGKKRAILVHIPAWFGLFVAKVLKRISATPAITESNVLGSTQDVPWDIEGVYRVVEYTPTPFDTGLTHAKQEIPLLGARLMLSYVCSRAPYTVPISNDLARRYVEALVRHGISTPLPIRLIRFPFLLGPLDAVSKLLYPHSPLQKRIFIASALVETIPATAEWLLPKERSFAALSGIVLRSGLSATLKLCVGLMLLCIPGFVRHHAKIT
jgi:NADH dehydrogenase